MKKIDKDLIKNIFTSLLIVIAIILLIMVILYSKISVGKVIPKAEEYILDNKISEELQNMELDKKSEVIITYKLDETDLKQYEKTQEYNKGKKDPFAEESTPDTNQNNSNIAIENNSVNSSSGHFYKDDGIK